MNLILIDVVAVQKVDPCNPSPCGANAVCNSGICTCLAEYFGDPYKECRPECVLNSDCAKNKACNRNKCVDPCPGVCGQNAECSVYNHVPICNCIPDYYGDPFTVCRKRESKLRLLKTKPDILQRFNCFRNRTTNEPLRAFTVRTVQLVQNHQQPSCLYMPNRIYRLSPNLQT